MISKKELLEKMAEFANTNQGASGAWNSLSFWLSQLPDDQPDLLPFEYPVKEGYEVVTRDGRKVEQLTRFDAKEEDFPLIGVLGGLVESWTFDGLYSPNASNYNGSSDLFLRRKEKKVWVVEWDNGYTAHGKYPSFGEYNGSKAIYEATLKLVV